MNKSSTYYILSGVVFGFAAILHFVRLSFGFDLVLGGWMIPVWMSGVAVVLPGILSVWSFRHLVKEKHEDPVSRVEPSVGDME